MSLSDIMAKAELYSTPSAAKAKKKESLAKAFRVSTPKAFMQPTKDGTNFKYCYYGMLDSEGNFMAGFNMNNAKMLEAVKAGLLSESFAELFLAFADKYAALGKEVL